MKNKLLLLSLCVGCSTMWAAQSKDDPELMKVNGKCIKKSEFEYIYNKNNQQQVDNKSLDEYLVLFKNYKLKVAEAESAGIDTTADFRHELASYRVQLAKPYLVDKDVDENLAEEAYNRLKENVEVSHILFKVTPNASNEEKDVIYKKAKSVLERARKGEDFQKLAKEYSEDPSVAQNNGDLGYIGGFMTVYPFETAAYNTPVGQISEPILSQFGYHIVKVTNRRADRGEVLTAHIMLLLSDKATREEKQEKEAQINEIYQQILQGADFAQLAKEKSEDKNTALKGGELPWLATGRVVKEYEDVAFTLKEKGDVAVPVLSPFGWHIIKLIDKRDVKSYTDMKAEILRRIARDERGGKSQEVLVNKLKAEYNFTVNEIGKAKLIKLSESISPADSLFLATIQDDHSLLGQVADSPITIADFAVNLSRNNRKKLEKEQYVGFLTNQLDEFFAAEIIKYEDSRLEGKYSDFKNLMNEYRDGMLLFEISNREVWDKASKDTEGLAKFFKANKKDYAWKQPRYKGYLIQCSNDSIAKVAKKKMKSYPADSVVYYVNKEINNDSVKFVKVEKGLYLQGDNKMVDNLGFKQKNEITPDEKFPIAFTSGKILKKGPEAYTDVRGQVTADYQTFLEKVWVAGLNKKYSVEINEDVLKTVNKK